MMQGLLGNYNGMPVNVTPTAIHRRQFRFPRSKKKRIRKKFAKNQDNYKSTPGAYMMMGRFIVHPAIYEKMKDQLTHAV